MLQQDVLTSTFVSSTKKRSSKLIGQAEMICGLSQVRSACYLQNWDHLRLFGQLTKQLSSFLGLFAAVNTQKNHSTIIKMFRQKKTSSGLLFQRDKLVIDAKDQSLGFAYTDKLLSFKPIKPQNEARFSFNTFLNSLIRIRQYMSRVKYGYKYQMFFAFALSLQSNLICITSNCI